MPNEAVALGEGLQIWTLVAGAVFQTNCYLLADPSTRKCVIVDPGQDVAVHVLRVVAANNLEPVAILLTHGHMDPSWDCVPLAAHFGVPMRLHPSDREFLTYPENALPGDFPAHVLAGYPRREPEMVEPLLPQSEVCFGVRRLLVRAAPGHTPGSVMFLLPGSAPAILAGDSLMEGKVGLAVPPVGNLAALYGSVRLAGAEVPADTLVLPGHGSPFALADVPL
jgi:hydroxyacylglutathione hydrolase